MIRPQELRIGNYISDLDGKIIKVEELTICASYITKKRINNLPFDYYKPIPLTEEILLKLGFKQNEQFKTNFKFYLKEDEIDINIYNGKNNSWLNDRYIINLKYVHQLQNLFFSLCGEELTFK